MAQRKTAPRRTARKSPARNRRVPVSMVFWVLFFVVLVSIFFFLLPMAKNGMSIFQRKILTEQPAVQEPLTQEPSAQEQKPPPQEPRTQPKPQAEKPAEKPPAKPETKPLEQRQPPAEKPPAKPPEQPTSKPETQQPARQPTPQSESKPLEQRQPPETRDRTVYFMREGGGGDLTLAKTTRKLAVSDSPLIDCVNALLAGPTAEEKKRGLSSFIPPNTRLLSARVVNNTVHLNFNEAFRYNTFGREGCDAQLRQIVWTATEFSNVNNVQIEIEGKIVDFLIEGVTIRNPIGR